MICYYFYYLPSPSLPQVDEIKNVMTKNIEIALENGQSLNDLEV